MLDGVTSDVDVFETDGSGFVGEVGVTCYDGREAVYAQKGANAGQDDG